MDIQEKTKEELQKELIELRQEYNSFKELYEKEDSMRKHTYDEMSGTNLKLTLAMQGGNMAWWEMDVPTGNVTFDKHKVEMLGYPPENFTHYKDFTILVHPLDYEKIMNAMRGHLEGTLDKYEAEYRILASSGEFIWFYDYGSVVKKDAKGNPLICTGFVYNITDRKKNEETLAKSERLLSSIYDSVGDLLFLLEVEADDCYRFISVNNAFCKVTGLNEEMVLGKLISEVIPEHSLSTVKVKHRQAIKESSTIQWEDTFDYPIGQLVGDISITPIFDKKGFCTHLVGSVHDITQKKEFEKKILRDKESAEQLINSIPGLFYQIDVEGKFVNWNKNLESVSGYSNNEIAEISPLDFFAGEDKLNIEKNIIQVFSEGNASIEATLISKNQTEIPYYFTGKKITIDDQIYLSGLGIDISTKKINEEKLLKSENMLQTVLDNFPGVVFWKDRLSKYLGCNQAFSTGAGLKSTAEVVGKTDLEMPWVSTEAIKYRQDDLDVMECGKERLHIIETQHQSDGQVIWLDTSKFPLRDSSGLVIGVIGVSNDISALKMAEQELVNKNKELVFQNEEKEKRAAELIIANKELVFQNEEKEKRAAELIIANKELMFQNEEKEKRAVELIIAKDKAEASDRLKTAFMNNISHEIRTPLNGILGIAPLIIQPDITMEEKEEFLEMLNFSSKRLMNTVTDYMDISLIITDNLEVHPKPIDISLMLTKVFEYFQKACMKKKLELKMQFPDNTDNFILNMDEELLRKAVSKLVDNSVKFTKEGSITVGFKLLNNEVEIFVKDTGKGIEKDAQERIYEYFMQEEVSNTRGHEGSGLGLSITKGIMRLLGGKVRLDSIKNFGTTVFLTLPGITSTASSNPKNFTNAIKVEGIPIILIAEDDDLSYFYIDTLLRKVSKTLRACNGQEAVDLCRKHPNINLVVMDIKMPVMNGIEATLLIKSFRNDLPIIAVTAFAQSGDEFKIKEAGCDDYLSKPISNTEILSLIQKHLII